MGDRNLPVNPSHIHAAKHAKYIAMLGKASRDYFKSFSLAEAREVDANGDVGAIAAACGVLGSDTTPIYQSNTPGSDGDNAARIAWAASNNDPIMFQCALPPHLDSTKDLTLSFLILSAGATDAVGFTVESWFNVGDTKVTDTSGTADNTAGGTVVTATIAADDIPTAAAGGFLTFTIAPVAHTTDIMYLYGLKLTGFLI